MVSEIEHELVSNIFKNKLNICTYVHILKSHSSKMFNKWMWIHSNNKFIQTIKKNRLQINNYNNDTKNINLKNTKSMNQSIYTDNK